jgi:hypothetical protein
MTKMENDVWMAVICLTFGMVAAWGICLLMVLGRAA